MFRMQRCSDRLRVLPLAALIAGVAMPVQAQTTASATSQLAPPVTVDDYAPWKRITSVALSPDGTWMSYLYDRLEGEDTLYVKPLEGGDVHVAPRGSAAAFSQDSRWVGYLVSPPESDGEGDGARPQQRPGAPTPGRRPGQGRNGGRSKTLVLRNLISGDSTSFSGVMSLSFPENTGLLLIRKGGQGEDAGFDGSDLVVHTLDTGSSLNLGNVSQFAVNEPGTHLAYLVDAKDDAGNGAYLLNLRTNGIAPLDTRQATYSRLTWSEDGMALAALRGQEPEGMVRRDNVLLVLDDLERPGNLRRYEPSATTGFPEGFVLSELGAITWSDDSERVFLGIKEQVEEREELEGRADVHVWHWADVEVQSVQKVREERNANATWNSVVNVRDDELSFVRLADETLATVTQAGDSRWGIGRDPTPYEYDIAWGGSEADYYRVDLDTGERTPLAQEVGRQMGSSPDGEWWLSLRDEEVIATQLESGRQVNLTEASGVDFINRDDDHPYELPIWGVGGWSEDGDRVLLYDKFDVWEVAVDGGETSNLTAGIGARDQIQFRVTKLSSEAPQGFRGRFFGGAGTTDPVDLDEPVLLTAYGEWTKKSGYWRVERGDEPESLIWLDKSVGRPLKASAAETMVFTQQTFVEFPNYWVSDTEFADAWKVTEANPQQADFAWSPGRVLIDYVDDRGNQLQATLGLPAGYQEGQQYPMLVYFYEKMSQRHHRYQGPTYDDRPHMATYASNGYLVLQPDIVYEVGKPGTSAVDDLTSAVEKVIELGYADPARIGLQGHSWSGYQSSFVVTQTDMFAAVVTGAPPTNLVSFYNTLYRSSGRVQQGITEVGQVRMGTTPFEDFDLYVSQSPIHHTQDITTPFMILHGEEDGAVEYLQGLEYYNMARRLGKEVILLSYPGAGHHLVKKENRLDFLIRMTQYFDHHVKGLPMPKWMSEGVPLLERDYANPREMMDGTLWGKPPEAEGPRRVTEGEGRGGPLP